MSKSAKGPAKPKEKRPSFEQNLEKLQQIVNELEQGELDLATSLKHYEDGVQCLKQCYRQLERAEQRVELLSGQAADGQACTEPFDEKAMSLEEKAEARGARRTRSKRPAADPPLPDNVDDTPGLF